MAQAFTIPDKLPGLNEYTNACRAHWAKGSDMKREATDAVAWAVKEANLKPYKVPVEIGITWIEGRNKNGRLRDVDNIRFGAKFILDALVRCGIIPDDNPYWVRRIYDNYRYNANDPHIKVWIEPYKNELRRVLYQPVTGLEEQWQ